MCQVEYPEYTKCGHWGAAITKNLCMYGSLPDTWKIGKFCYFSNIDDSGKRTILINDWCEDCKAPRYSESWHRAMAWVAEENAEMDRRSLARREQQGRQRRRASWFQCLSFWKR
ncbi:hypothetical protein HYFRA_00008104 [Hymenoscyphus fraxineus]|uniref:Uncharacterized protein n=1 Tax=Hymenoscyphus fraxineus TaxID=746836 RepID=A0A9N9LBE4_9HELO|nr:hypothetical protein HYFRA_00008104 [Hymenoscyphus fraxineus]